jgi:hypothetical protein
MAIRATGYGCESRLAGRLYQIRKYCSRTAERKQRAETTRGPVAARGKSKTAYRPSGLRTPAQASRTC